MKEPVIKVGIIDRTQEISILFDGLFRMEPSGRLLQGAFRVCLADDGFSLYPNDSAAIPVASPILSFVPEARATFSIDDVTIGIKFHWERRERQTFQGSLRLERRDNGMIAVINEIPLEAYLVSVVSSEMRAGAPLAFLKAHAIASRSWLVAMLEREAGTAPDRGQCGVASDDRIVRWYEREDHDIYDVCADDHCQRYQGVTRVISDNARQAVAETTGRFLTYDEKVCDARFYKACGGLTESYENVWADHSVPYLVSLSDAPMPFAPIGSEQDAAAWIAARPDAFCNISDPSILETILPDFDRDTAFFRWQVAYEREELEAIIREKSGLEIGSLLALEPALRGPSGRIIHLVIRGTKRSVTVGKELEIRRWLSRSHLPSSAFVVETEQGEDGLPKGFVLRGAGWGHGVGLCQIGAAMMALKGYKAEEILMHYFPGAIIEKRY